MNRIEFEKSRTDPILSLGFETDIDVLRLDLIHPVISGNKWFKLKKYLEDAQMQRKSIILTFGGAFSNHIAATAAAANLYGLKSIGIIRGEKPEQYSHTLTEALRSGMELFFVSRESYREKKIPEILSEKYHSGQLYMINEGGYGEWGARGAMDILAETDTSRYTHIVSAVGTGTTLAGLVRSCNSGQQVAGISVMKNNFSLSHEINELLPAEKKEHFKLEQAYHFGGYAKYTSELISFMNEWFRQTGIPSDFVYTGKLFYAVRNMIREKKIPPASRVLVIHSGGLQGNLSLPNGTLIF